jgi:N-sulfoglucosamine sulfohydrolase
MFHAWAGKESFRVEAMSGLSFPAMNKSLDENIRARVKQLTDGETWMLFDIKADPSERKNLVGDPKYARDFDSLLQKLLNHMKQTDDPLLPQIESAVTELSR